MEENYRRLKEINKKLRREIRHNENYIPFLWWADLNELNIKELQALEAKMDSSLLAIRERKATEIPDIHRDPNRNLFSDEASGELDEKKKGMELSVNSIEADKIWHYQDPLGKIQGPFAMAMLRGWSSSGHFPPELRVWR
ncbi:hypothetical protein Gotur_015429, partial [Gossypium turneri]